MKLNRSWLIRLGVAVFLVLLISGQALAAFLCRADPVVVLSNGVTMDIGASISTYPWQVTNVDYVLHVPVGVSAILVVHTPTWLTSQETFTLIADQAPGRYKTITTVHTTEGNAEVLADTTLISVLGLRLGSKTAPGFEGEALVINF